MTKYFTEKLCSLGTLVVGIVVTYLAGRNLPHLSAGTVVVAVDPAGSQVSYVSNGSEIMLTVPFLLGFILLAFGLLASLLVFTWGDSQLANKEAA